MLSFSKLVKTDTCLQGLDQIQIKWSIYFWSEGIFEQNFLFKKLMFNKIQ